MFYLKFPQLGPEKTIIYTWVTWTICITIACLVIFTYDYPAASPKLLNNPKLYIGFRLVLIINLALSLPALVLPVGSALKIYEAHPLLAYPFTLINIFDLLVAFGYVVFYLPILYLRVTGDTRRSTGAMSGSVAMSILIYLFKIVFQTTAYTTMHKCVEEMCAGRFNEKYSLDTVHELVNLVDCLPFKKLFRINVDLVPILGLCRLHDEEMAVESGG